MKKIFVLFVVLAMLVVPMSAMAIDPLPDDGPSPQCWGQVSAAFAQTGVMGEHSSSFDTPRLGLGNLARVLADAGTIPDDTLAALGAYLADELGLSIAACE